MEEFKSNLVNSVLALEAENKRLEAKVRDLQDELNQEKSKRSRWMTEVNVLHLVLNQCGVRITEVDLSQLMGAPNRQANIEEYMRKMHKERIAVESRPGELFSPEQEQRICELAHNAAQQPVNQYRCSICNAVAHFIGAPPFRCPKCEAEGCLGRWS